MWIDVLLVLRIFHCLCQALFNGLLFCDLIEVKLSHFLCEALCGGLTLFNQVVVKLLCCLHKASCVWCKVLVLSVQGRE